MALQRSLSVCVCLCVFVSVCVSKGLRGMINDEKLMSRFIPAPHSTPVRPANRCVVNGITLFNGAAWSPDPCSVCVCESGSVRCHSVPCEDPAPAVKRSPEKSVPQPNGKQKTIPKENTSPAKTVEAPPTAPRYTAPHWPTEQEADRLQTSWEKKFGFVRPERFPKRIRDRFDYDDHDDDDYMDDDSDIDDDDDEDATFFHNNSPGSHRLASADRWASQGKLASAGTLPSTGRVASALRVASAGKLASANKVASAQKVAPAPRVASNNKVAVLPAHIRASPQAKRPVAPPTKHSVVLPPVRPLPGPSGRSTIPRRPVLFGPRLNVHMESLPPGCLLSESLIACGSTHLTHLPLLRDPGIKTLYLPDNKISKIPTRALAGLPNLEWLDLSKNQLDDASLGLDVFRNLTKLKRLNLDGNNLTKVPPLPPSLLELKINDNKLSGLTPHSFKGLSQLLTLELEDNHFHDGNVSPLAFRHLGRLIYLRLDDNDFRALPSGLPPSLQELHLSDNRIEVVHAGLLNKTLNLRVLNLSHNKIREDRIAPRAWIHLRKLESLDLSYNKLVHVPSFLPVGLRQFILHHNQIERVPGYVFGLLKPGLDSLHLSYNRLREDGVSAVSFHGLQNSLTELLLDHNQLRAIPQGVIQLRALRILRLNHNYISSVPMNSLCDSTAREDSPLLSVHLQYNLIDRRLIPHSALSCIRTYHSIVLRPQRHEHLYE